MSSHAAKDIPAPWLGPRPIKGRRTVISGEGGSFSLDRVWKLSSWTENPPQHHRPLGSPSPGPVPGGLDAGRHLGPTPSAMRCRHSAARAPQMPVCCNASGYSGNRTFLGDPQPPSSIRERNRRSGRWSPPAEPAARESWYRNTAWTGPHIPSSRASRSAAALGRRRRGIVARNPARSSRRSGCFGRAAERR